MDIAKYEISADELRWQCAPAVFDFECTKDLAPLGEFIGQDRAIRAIEFGLSMKMMATTSMWLDSREQARPRW